MAFKLIKSQNQFKKHISNFKNSYLTLPHNPTINQPDQYPCLCYTYINNDVNGLGAKNIFVYKKDFKLFK